MEQGARPGRGFPVSICGLAWLLVAWSLLLVLAGCSSTQEKPPVSRPAGKFSPGTTWYRVRKGDTLYAVSWRAGVDWKTLARWNGLKKPYTIYPGQRLRLKPPPHSTRRATSSTRRSSGSSASRSTSSKKRTSSRVATRAKSSTRKTTRKGASATRMQWQWPVKGRIVSRFSHQNPDLDGIKIAGKAGEKIRAAESGTVVYVGSGLIGYGQLIIIKHNNEFLSAYGLNSRLYVREGQKVKKGQHISDMGRNSAGKPMLHFEIRRYGKPVDPLAYLPRG